MKIKDRLVITLCDFSGMIDFPTFQSKRKQFLRDLNPQRCYYWADKQKMLFEVIKTWVDIEEGNLPESEWIFGIEQGQDQAMIVGFKNREVIVLNHFCDNYVEELQSLPESAPYRNIGIIALCELIERRIGLEEIKLVYGLSINMESSIIKVLAGTSLYLKSYDNASDEPIITKKIEVVGENGEKSEIYINNVKQIELFAGECIYTTSKGDGFIQLLPNKIEQDNLLYTLFNEPGEYTSGLLIENMDTGKISTYEGVTSFTSGKGGFAYLANGKLKSRWHGKDTDIHFLLEPFDIPVSVSSNEVDHIFVLLDNGTIKSTDPGYIARQTIGGQITKAETGEVYF